MDNAVEITRNMELFGDGARRDVPDNSNGGFRAANAYRGLLYSETLRLEGCNRAHITVISAGYGLVGADDPIYNYNYEMKRDIARE